MHGSQKKKSFLKKTQFSSKFIIVFDHIYEDNCHNTREMVTA